jgi:hypothetical protein
MASQLATRPRTVSVFCFYYCRVILEQCPAYEHCRLARLWDMEAKRGSGNWGSDDGQTILRGPSSALRGQATTTPPSGIGPKDNNVPGTNSNFYGLNDS